LTQHSILRSLVLHLWPGAVFTGFIVLATAIGIDPLFALFGGIGLVLAPLGLAYLALHARRTTGSWSPLKAVDYKNRVTAGRLLPLSAALAAWFLLVLIVSIATLDRFLSENVFYWMPDDLRQFASLEGEESLSTAEVAVFLVVAFLFNGIAGPVAEELYFRGHLLPRLERYGAWAPVISTALFAVYHFFSPWRYPAIVIGFMPITWAAWRNRSIYISLASHMTINLVTVLLLFAAAVGAGE
jgi:membrane protease YdiL (CAAX protease family)